MQERVARVVSRIAGGSGPRPGRGAALVARGDVERLTPDLDLIPDGSQPVERLVPASEAALLELAMAIERWQLAVGPRRCA